MAKETKLLEIEVREVAWEGKSFLAYNTFTKNNERLDVRFVKHATAKAPKENCFIEVDTSQMNISRKYRYPRLYIQDIIKVVDRPTSKNDDLPF
ncbi:MAG: hypothetical protein BWY30_01147 [Tenericutes bacterium ADurb.Bin239]|nr:MAG: hypothetical protein BWY30_01147 [Tenericutes bacterium ADurb.Bin239]